MNRATRRAAGRQKSAPTDPLAEGLRTIHAEAGGALDLFVVGQADALDLIIDAAMGSAVAATLLNAAGQMATQTNAPPGKRPLCIACPSELADMQNVKIGLAVPHRDNPSSGLAFVICPACASAPVVGESVLSGLRRVWPNMRAVTVTHSDGGRA